MYEEDEEDVDKDSLHILPLKTLPLETKALSRARLIKNVRLTSVVEVFAGGGTGSGQVEIEQLAQEFHWDMRKPPKDFMMMRKIAKLPSYDVFSLRIALREMDIEIANQKDLQLSPAMTKELSSYMTDFTRPLIQQIYGEDDVEISGFGDVVNLFRNPDMKKALEKIRIMSQKLEIQPEEIPKFMEDYGDIFLSLSYYRRCLDDLEPRITEFLDAMHELRGNFHYQKDTNLMDTMAMLEATINERMAAVTGRFENFERGTKYMWDEISATRFRKVENLIKSYHHSIGGVLCALTVKMDAWIRLFPNKKAGGPGRRAEFILSEMKQGIDNMVEIEDSAPMLAALD